VIDVRPTITRAELAAKMQELAAAGAIASVTRNVKTPDGKEFTLRDGGLVRCEDGSRYRIANMNRGGFTLQREISKVRGKAARRADRAHRRDAREHNARLEARRREQLAHLAQDEMQAAAVASEDWP
jgi:hypothetical protein